MRSRSISSESGEKKKKAAVAALKAKKATKAEKVVEVSLRAGKGAQKGGHKKAQTTAALKKAEEERAALEAKRTLELLTNGPSAETLKAFRKASSLRKAELQKRSQPRRVSKANFLAKQNPKGKKYTLDLRIHCPGTVGYFADGGIEPGPALSRLSRIKGLDMIGLTNFYDANYIDLIKVREGDLTILPGFDLCCRIGNCREVYITALFPEHFRSVELQEVLNTLGVPEEARGRKDYCLELPFERILEAIEGRGGILIPTRVDKTPYRQLAIQTLIDEFGFRAFDLVHPENVEYFQNLWPDGGFTFLSFSNATALAQIGTRLAKVRLSQPGFAGIKELVARRAS